MPLFDVGDFTLSSGAPSAWLIDVDALTDTDLAAAADWLSTYLTSFDHVEAVPRGGMRFASHLAQHAAPGARRTLIVDDVFTTGASLERHRNGRGRCIGAVLFARGKMSPDFDWVTALWSLP